MPFKKILNNLYLGDQFSNNINTNYQLKISNIFYDVLLNQKEEKIEFCNKNNFVKTKTKLALNLLDSHSEKDFNNVLFAAATKFIKENITENDVYTHCQLGVSRSSSVIFVYLVINNKIKAKNFQEALTEYIDNFYPYMKLNLGVYSFLKHNFPFNEIKDLSNKSWGELECIT